MVLYKCFPVSKAYYLPTSDNGISSSFNDEYVDFSSYVMFIPSKRSPCLINTRY